MKKTQFKPGALVTLYGREWIVQPSDQPELLLLKPLGGTDMEIKGIHTALKHDINEVTRAEFPLPTEEDLGDFASARLLFEAARLSFRSGAGPFRSMGRLAFQPRAYQLVPLIMALRLKTVRLLLADDVGIGKTIEALMIARELLDRGTIKSFAVICLPHLCDQWTQELKDKFGIEAALISSRTVRSLERQLGPDQTLFDHFPYQVISIDYIKGSRKRELFLNHVPELVIVDEAHTCSSAGDTSSTRSQRHQVVKAIAANPEQHLVLLTATPHSGKPEEFQSILGLVKPEFEAVDLTEATDEEKREVARHFLQRRRKNVEKWMDEKTPFPERLPLEQAYKLSSAYRRVFQEVLKLARKLAATDNEQDAFNRQLRYYLAIGLLRGVMSSPAMGTTMLQNRLRKHMEADTENQVLEDQVLPVHNPSTILDSDFDQQDQAPTELTEQADFSSSEQRAIRALEKQVAALHGLQHDRKAAALLELVRDWLPTDNTIVFCRYIQTANYLGEILTDALRKTFGTNLLVEVVTSELTDEERKERVVALGSDANQGKHKLLIATDCMSEGINLQEQFSAVIHYDLPWNPNRLEQREGRIDRFGQPKDEVRTLLLYGEDNPMDGTVLKVLLRKAREIRRATGIAVPFPDDSKTIMDAVLTSVLLSAQQAADDSVQTQFDFGKEGVVQQQAAQVEQSFERIQEREKQITSVFAQNKIKPQELVPYLCETEEALGNAKAVHRLIEAAMPHFNTVLESYQKGYRLSTTNLPTGLKYVLPDNPTVLLSFDSPTPAGYTYLGRNHAFVEHVCLRLLDAAFSRDPHLPIARAAVFRSNETDQRLTLYLLRVRNVIADHSDRKELVAEELQLYGFRGDAREEVFFDAASELYKTPTQEVPPEEKRLVFQQAIRDYVLLEDRLLNLASARADHMIEGHEQFRKKVNGDHFKKVVPVLPPDVLGVYVILPEKPHML